MSSPRAPRHSTIDPHLLSQRKGMVCAGIAAALGCALGASRAAAAPVPDNFFMIGAYLQPYTSMATWQPLGVNTMVGFYASSNNTQAEWDNEAAQLGFYTIRAPSANPASDVNNPNLIAWSQPDEPDANGISASSLLATYNSLKAVDPTMPVYTNFSGGYVLGMQGSMTAANYAAYTAATDWVSSDIYPVTGWGLPNQLGLVGQSITQLSSDSGGMPQYAYIETSNQNLPWVANERGPTAAEVRGETWDAIIHGARGIVYFSYSFNPYPTVSSVDATPASVAAGITQQDALITALAAVIDSAPVSNPQSLSFANGSTLEGAWRIYNGVEYYFVLNLSDSAVSNATFTLPNAGEVGELGVYDQFRDIGVGADGTVTDSFAPDQLNIYSTDITLVPEPTVFAPLCLIAGLFIRRPRCRRI